MSVLGSGMVAHIIVLPFLDLTLIAVNAVIGIVFSVLLSIFVLGEKLIPKYDISGLFFISVGSAAIVLCANKVEKDFTGKEVIAIYSSAPAMILLIVTVSHLVINFFAMCRFVTALRRFESDVESSAADKEKHIIGFEGLSADSKIDNAQENILPMR